MVADLVLSAHMHGGVVRIPLINKIFVYKKIKILYIVRRKKWASGQNGIFFQKYNAFTHYFLQNSCPLLVLKVGRKWAFGQKL